PRRLRARRPQKDDRQKDGAQEPGPEDHAQAGGTQDIPQVSPSGSAFSNRTIRPGDPGRLFFGAPGGAHLLGGESPLLTRQGEEWARGSGDAGDRSSG